jgi:murein L,D-transpeptidase YcbB/YkuD
MTEIGLLMMGVLNPKQLNIPHVPSQKLPTIENGLDLKNHQSNKLVGYTQTTPPEFSQPGKNSSTHLLKLSFRRQTIFEKISHKQMSHNSFELADAGNIPRTNKRAIYVSKRYSRTQNTTMPVISFGSSGTPVQILQKLLVSNGYGITIDGIFGPITETAVKAFQNRRRLSIDGVVGRRTWWELTI